MRKIGLKKKSYFCHAKNYIISNLTELHLSRLQQYQPREFIIVKIINQD